MNTQDIRSTLTHLSTLCDFLERYDRGLEGLAAIDKTKAAIHDTLKALDKLDTAFSILANTHSDVESHAVMAVGNPKRMTGIILTDYERGLRMSCILDEMKNEHIFFSQKGVEELLNCLQVGLDPEPLWP